MSNKSSYMAAAGVVAVLALGIVPALAQEAAAPAQPPAAAPAAPAAPAAAADPAAAAPVQTAEAPPAPPPPPPTLPTTGDGAVITTLLTKVCSPLIKGGNIDALAKSAGMAQDRKTKEYVVSLSQRPFQVAIAPPSERNKNVCEMRVRYAPGWDAPIIESMNIWRFLHEPQLRLARNDVGQYSDAQRTTTTWDNWDSQAQDGKMIGLILVQLNKADGKAVDPTFDEAIVQYSERAALSAAQAAQTPTTAAAPAG